MSFDYETNNLIALSLAGHYECVYLVDIETNRYIVFSDNESPSNSEYPDSGDDFFADAVKNAALFIHPDDLDSMFKLYDKNEMLSKLEESGGVFSIVFRAFVGGRITRMRHIEIMCKDGKHLVCCLENIEEEIRKSEEKERDLQSAKMMARRDALTGVRNSNAYREYIQTLESDFGIVMFDINDLKLMNDTRGHSFGDEAIQCASRMICEIYKHSQVFRIGGDEFVAVLSGHDYEHRDALLEKFKEESLANNRSRSGPVVACGMAVFDPETDNGVDPVYVRADKAMYENKNELKSMTVRAGFADMNTIDTPIPDERKRLLDGLFGAMYTVAGEGYVYLNDMKYDFSRWSLQLIDDFGMESEYMYHADKIWQEYIHPDDMSVYKEAVDAVLTGDAKLRPIVYRARKKDGSYVMLTTRGFVLSDSDGNPEYFGGIIIEKK